MPTLPNSPRPASFNLKSRTRTQISTATSGKVYSRQLGGQWFELRLVYPIMTAADFAPINAFLTAQGGQNGIFDVELPADLAGVTGNAVGNLGTYSDDTKVHMITETDPGLVVYPVARNGGAGFSSANPVMRCSLMRDVLQMKMDNMGHFRFEIDLRERV